jgi:hypothetical protein
MGLPGICPVRAFLETEEAVFVESQAQTLLSAFFDAMHAKTVHMSLGLDPEIKALLEHKAGNRLDVSRGYLDVLTMPVKYEVVPADLAARHGAIRMAELARPLGISTGISFGLDRAPLSPKTSWELILHRGPLPLLELGISDQAGFMPPPGWLETLRRSGAVEILNNGKRYLGTADNLYLWLKRSHIFPHSKGLANVEAVTAGQHLRQLCREMFPHGQAKSEARLSELSFWRWRQKRFIRTFDKALIKHVGSDKLNAVLKAMGTSPAEWFRAY